MSLELGRRLVHASGAVIPGAYLLDEHVLEAGVVTWPLVQAVAVAGLILTGVLEFARLYGGLDHAFYDRLTREYEEDSVAGYALYVLSGTVVVLLFEPRIAVPAVLMLTLGDPISGLVGSGEFRRVKRPPALATMFLVCTAIAVPFVPDAPLAAVLASAVATVADGVKPVVRGYVIDDNLTIPPLAAAALLAGLELSVALA